MARELNTLSRIICLVIPILYTTSGFAEDRFVAVEPYYRLKTEVGIYGVVTKRTGTRVVFQPCAGEAKEIEDSELEPTLNTCDDGDGPSFAFFCDQTVDVSTVAKTYFDSIGKKIEVGTVFETKNGELTPTDIAAIAMGKTVVKVQSCNKYWSVGIDVKGDAVVKMLSVDPIKLTNSKTLE
jgi:hypothetical protein